MERQAGLGRSLEDVFDFLPPPDAASAPERVLFEPQDLEEQLDALMGDMRDLRGRVQHLVGLVSDDGAAASPSSVPLASPDPDDPWSTPRSGKKGPERARSKEKSKKSKDEKKRGKGKNGKKRKKGKNTAKTHKPA